MGLDVLLGCNAETSAKLIGNFLKTGKSKELDLALDTSRWELPSSELIVNAGYFRRDGRVDYVLDDAVSLGVQTSLRQATAYLTDNYKYDGDKKYLTQLIILSAAFDKENAPKFYEKLQKSDFYAKLGKHLRSLINEKYDGLMKNN
jgi:hypothetical protein